ncbi:alcohol dehydrogenase catalytic domain-containing protein [Cryobacterium sp. MP_M3]|uniref:alcohol dehydrogenase catalytic domain-containing protein n=1 Tax=unclassified Cryobacterium TaxID=2649013 RepID=UPI0018CA6E70
MRVRRSLVPRRSQRGLCGRRPADPRSRSLGHEASGTVVEVGSSGPRARIGERAAIEPQCA